MSLSESTAQGSLGRGTRNGETALTYQLKLPYKQYGGSEE